MYLRICICVFAYLRIIFYAKKPELWSYIPPIDHALPNFFSCVYLTYLTPNCPIFPLFIELCLLSILMTGPIYPQLSYLRICVSTYGPIYPQLTTLCRTFFLCVLNLFNPKLSYIPLIYRTLLALNSVDGSYIPPVVVFAYLRICVLTYFLRTSRILCVFALCNPNLPRALLKFSFFLLQPM